MLSTCWDLRPHHAETRPDHLSGVCDDLRCRAVDATVHSRHDRQQFLQRRTLKYFEPLPTSSNERLRTKK